MKDWFQVEMLDDTTYVISEHKHYEKKFVICCSESRGLC